METLSNKVAAQNKVNKEAKELLPKLVKWLTPYIGKKVVNANESFVKALRDTKPEGSFFIKASRYHLWLYVKTQMPINATFDHYLAEINEGVLIKLLNPSHLHIETGYTTEEIWAAKEKIRKLTAEINKIRNDFNLEKFDEAY